MRLQEAQTFLQNFFQADLTAASLVSEHMRQSPVADSGPESAALSHESLSELDSSPPCRHHFADAHGRVPIMTVNAPTGLHIHPFISISDTFGWTGGEIDGPWLRNVKAMASCQHCFTVPGFALNSIAKLGLDR